MDTNQPGGKPGVGNMPNLYWAYGVTVGLLVVLIVLESHWLLAQSCPGDNGSPGSSLGLTVLITGMLGGFVSSITRGIQDPSLVLLAPRPILIMQKLAQVLLGGIFSIVLYLIFAGQMLSGSLFPEFAKADVSSFNDFLCKTRPDAIVDYAKALVWSFLAGYSQTLVPNLFDQLINKAGAANGGDAGGKGDEGGSVAGKVSETPSGKTANPAAQGKEGQGARKPDKQ